MDKRVLCRFALLLSISGGMGSLAAADTQVDSVSTSSAGSVLDKVSEKAALSYFGVYRGASLSDPGNSLQPAVDGALDPTSPQSVENLVTAGYRINKDAMVGVITHFYYFPTVFPATSGQPVKSGQDLQMWDPILTLSKANIFASGGFKAKGTLNVQLPMSSADVLVRNNLATSISPSLSATYDVPGSHLSVGMFGYVKAYIPTESASDTVRTYVVYLAPNFNYQLSQKVAATLWVDLIQATRKKGTGFLSGLSNPDADLEPGVSWDITKNITLNPILNIYPSHLTLASTSFQALLIAKAF